ncbi:MAG: glycoside hydrolase family 3 C-terminal domain-containing protein [Terricaulis sp.]|nr:glycoside hydrolase family 3 C-terminal domain-containing protein [Terricaulis sp.]
MRLTKRALMRGVAGVLAGLFIAEEAAAQTRSGARAAPLYKDANAPLEARVEDLLRRMSLDEKIQQITTVWRQRRSFYDDELNFDPARFAALYPHGVGHIARPADRPGMGSPWQIPYRGPAETAELINAIQRYHLEHTRLGVPVLFHEEALHGLSARGATSFPISIALASTFDPDLVQRIFSIAARETRARGVHLVLAPVIDIARDPRWGRIEETYGEDPYLVGEMGVAAIRGFQGDALPLEDGRVFATLKHMTGHGQPEGGHNVAPAPFGERTLREMFFPPFEQAFTRTNVMAVMASYNEIDGVPSHANDWLLKDVLRREWGFRGAVVSDYNAIEQLADLHQVEPDWPAAAIRALRAGVDWDLPNGDGFITLAGAVREGRVAEQELDEPVRRMLRMKFLGGLFENPYADPAYAEAITDNEEARALAEEAARKSVVLLKNDGLLPLDAARIRRLAVIGPNAAAAPLGAYSNVPRRTISILEGLQARAGERMEILHHEGVRLVTDDPAGDWSRNAIELADPAENRRLIRQAVRLARRADTIVLCIGGSSAEAREGWADNHLGDRASIGLIGQQQELFDALKALGKPIVVVLINGRPQSIEAIAGEARAILEGWYLGQEGGTAMAQILFGDANPGGKLPVTIARHEGQIPLYYNHQPSARRGYLFESSEPLYPFGFGLSYTSFEISAPRLVAARIGMGQSAEVLVDVRNSGARAGDEVVQLYVRDVLASVAQPVKALRGFQRVTLQPGESRTLRFALAPEAFALWNQEMRRVVEPGAFEIMAGANSADVQSVTLTITA